MTGIVYNIQRYSLHDGPGIRTTVFFKGCPLRCLWCSNPESQRLEAEYMVDSLDGKQKLVGKEMSVEQVVAEALRDRAFYEGSGGGVTLSGGEALAQPEFAEEILMLLKAEGIHTAMETSGYGAWEKVGAVLSAVDMLLYDIKHMDEEKHRLYTGVSNVPILENLRRLSAQGKQIILRVPVVPEHNADAQTLKAIFDLAAETGIKTVELLPYHSLGESKYGRLSREYSLSGLKTQRKDALLAIVKGISVPAGVKVVLE